MDHGRRLWSTFGNNRSYAHHARGHKPLCAEDRLREMQQRIDAFVASGLQTRTTITGAVIARQGTEFQTLIDTVGQRTEAGRYYEQATSSDLPAGGFDTSQAPRRSGDTEYIRMRSGEQRATRRWVPAISDYRFTDIGRSYYSRL